MTVATVIPSGKLAFTRLAPNGRTWTHQGSIRTGFVSTGPGNLKLLAATSGTNPSVFWERASYGKDDGVVMSSRLVSAKWTKPERIMPTNGNIQGWDAVVSEAAAIVVCVRFDSATAADPTSSFGGYRVWESDRLSGAGWTPPQIISGTDPSAGAPADSMVLFPILARAAEKIVAAWPTSPKNEPTTNQFEILDLSIS